MYYLLRRGAKTVEEIAKGIGQPNTVRRTASRYPEQFISAPGWLDWAEG
jgi:hypothetical protein